MNLNIFAKKNRILLVVLLFAGFLLFTSFKPPAQNMAPLNMMYKPLDSSVPVQTTVIIEDSSTLNPIAGASVSCYLGTNLVYSGSTNAAGTVVFDFFSGNTITFTVTAVGYTSNSLTQLINSPNSLPITITILLTPNGGGNNNYIDVYCLDNGGNRVYDVYITSPIGSVLTDQNGYARVFLANGVNTLTFSSSHLPVIKGGYGWTSISFTDYTKTITPTSGSTWTAYVQQGALNTGNPPAPGGGGGGFDWTAILTWLNGSMIAGVPNWVLVAVVLAILILR